MKKIKSLKLGAYLTLALIVGVLAFGGIVKAAYNFSWLRVEDKTAEKLAEKIAVLPAEEELNFGAVSGPDLPNPYLVNDRITYIANQTAIDASTTVFSITPPESFQKVTSTGEGGIAVRTAGGLDYTAVTTTVDLAGIYQSAFATTTLTYSCGASTGPATAPTFVLLTGTVNTSTVGYFENNLTAALGGSVDGGTVAKIVLTPQKPYFVCTVTEQVAGGVTNLANTYTAKLTLRLNRTR